MSILQNSINQNLLIRIKKKKHIMSKMNTLMIKSPSTIWKCIHIKTALHFIQHNDNFNALLLHQTYPRHLLLLFKSNKRCSITLFHFKY